MSAECPNRGNANDSEKYPDVCVVTHPLGSAGENATRTLLEILSAITTVQLVTENLPADSSIREHHEFIELSEEGAGQSNVLVAATRFVRNQVRMCRAISRTDSSVVLFFGATAYLLPILFSKVLGRQVILEPRGDVPLTLRLEWERRMPAPLARGLAFPVWSLERLGYHVADGIITYTPSMARELDLDKFATKLYPNGARYVDTDRFHPEIPYEERDQVVGYLGRLDEEKGIRELARVAKHLPADVTFRFIGDGGLMDWLQTELQNEKETGTVEFTGWIDHDLVPRELNRLSLLVMPSQPTEGLPTTILEALASGTPVYATPVSGIPDVIIEGKTGFLMNDTEPNEVAEKIQYVLKQEDMSKLSQRCRHLAISEYSFEAAVNRYNRIFNQLLSC